MVTCVDPRDHRFIMNPFVIRSPMSLFGHVTDGRNNNNNNRHFYGARSLAKSSDQWCRTHKERNDENKRHTDKESENTHCQSV